MFFFDFLKRQVAPPFSLHPLCWVLFDTTKNQIFTAEMTGNSRADDGRLS